MFSHIVIYGDPSMPTSLNVTPVSFHNGQKRINLRAALEKQQYKTSSVEMTFGELARAYLAVHMSDVSVCETNRGTWLKEGFGSSFNLRSEDEIEI